MPREHDKSHFYKYFTANTVKLVLESRQLKWSTPTLFNDPFDHQTSLIFGFTEEEFVSEWCRVIDILLFDENPPEIIHQTSTNQLISKLRGHTTNNIRDRMRHQISEQLLENKKLEKYKQQLNNELFKQLTHSRVFCVTEDFDNVVMWSHYADEHRGAVLQLNCIDEIDDNLLAARPITYSENFPSFASVQEWVGHLVGTNSFDYQELLFNTAFLKHSDWSYEREWRVHIPLMPYEKPGDGISFYEKDKKCYGALYLGCRMSQDDMNDLIKIRNRNFPQMPVFQMAKSNQAFKLEHIQIF